MKNVFILIYLLFLSNVYSQNVGIGTATPDGTAKLELNATDKGFLPTRVALTDIVSPAPITKLDGTPALAADIPDGLMIFNTASSGTSPNNVVPGFYFWDATNTKWKALFASNSVSDVGVVVAYPGATLPNDVYLPLSGGTYNKIDYPEFTNILGSLDANIVTSTATTFTLSNWNSDGSFLRGTGGNASAIGLVQLDATALPNSNFSTSGSLTSTSGSHNHNFYTANNDVNNSASQGYPSGNNHVALRTTDRRQTTQDNGTIQTEGNHAHSIPSLTVTGGGDVETRPINRSVTWAIKVKPSAAYVGAMTVNNFTGSDDDDWFVIGTSTSSSDINDNIYTQGNVSIGSTTVPTERLEINGAIKFTGNGTSISRAPRVIRTEDPVAGCPPNRAANTDLFVQTFTMARAGSIKTSCDMIRRTSGRADLFLFIDGVKVDQTLTYTSSTQWEDAHVKWVGTLTAGTHTISVRSPQANVWGCTNEWSSIDTIIFEE